MREKIGQAYFLDNPLRYITRISLTLVGVANQQVVEYF